MPHQQDLFPPETAASENSRPPESVHPPAPVWMQRMSIVILVVFCFYMGLLLFLLPWSRYWQDNHFLLSSTLLGPLLNSGVTRGVVSGLGLLDVWIGISEIVHYREYRA